MELRELCEVHAREFRFQDKIENCKPAGERESGPCSMKDSFAVDGSTLWAAIVIETMWSSLRAGPITGPSTTYHSTQTFLRAHGNSATTLNGDLQGSAHF